MDLKAFVSPREKDNISIQDAIAFEVSLAKGGIDDIRIYARPPIVDAFPTSVEDYPLERLRREGFPLDQPIHILAAVEGGPDAAGEHNVAQLVEQVSKSSSEVDRLRRAYELLHPDVDEQTRLSIVFRGLLNRAPVVRAINQALRASS